MEFDVTVIASFAALMFFTMRVHSLCLMSMNFDGQQSAVNRREDRT
jgi:hypothetical protein